MNAYPIGNDLTVKWSLLYSDGSVFPLSNYDYELSYRTNRGNKVVTDTSVISVDENILTWTFKGDEQAVSGRYTICLKITLSGSRVIELQYDNAFMLSPLSGLKGAGSEIVLQSYCDAIDLKDAVLQARKAMDIAANAVVDTANSARDAKAAKAAAEVTAAQAKVDAESAKTMAADAKDKVTVAEKAATDASRDAVAAQQAAQTASDHITSLQQAIAELPDGQAVTEKVAEHTIKLTELESEIFSEKWTQTKKNSWGWLFYKLAVPVVGGKTYRVSARKINNGSVKISTATTNDYHQIVDNDVLTISYLDNNVWRDETFVASGDAAWVGIFYETENTVDIKFGATDIIEIELDEHKKQLNSLSDTVSTNTGNITTNTENIADLIDALGKGDETSVSTTYTRGYYINGKGELASDDGHQYSSPIQVLKGDVLLMDAFAAAPVSPFNETDEEGTYYKSLIGTAGPGQYEKRLYALYCIKDGYVAVSNSHTLPSSIKKTTISVLKSIANKLIELDHDAKKVAFETMLPSYVFGIESGSFGGREYATALYPEAIVSTQVYSEDGQPENPKVQIYARLNGTKRLLFQKSKSSKSASYNTPVESIAKEATIGGDGLVSKTFNFDYIRANRKNGQNKKMFILIIGASITQQGGYPGYLQMYGDMDNTDIGDIDVKVLGSNVGTVTPSITYNYNGETKTIITHTEGRAGWTTYGIANWPFEARADGAIDTLGAEGMWYAAGLSTKTPYNSNTPGQAAEVWTGTSEQKLKLFKAVFGRFKPDYCAELWTALHNFHYMYRSGAHTIWYYSTGSEYTNGANIPAYNGSASNAIIDQFFDAICDNPDNVFYDRDRARAYTGSYVWTNKTAFSISKWVERYRTLDDNGNQLTLGEGTGTFVTSANINNPVCTPTIVFNGMGANDLTGMYVDAFHTIAGIKDAIKNLLIDFLDDLHTQLPTAPIGWGCPRQSGVFYPEDWYDFGVIPKITFYSLHRDWLNALMMPEFASLDIANKYNYVPIYFTSSPVSGQSPRYVGDFDRKDSESNLVVTGGDLGHVGEEWEKSVAYQILAWMYWAFQPTE